MIATILGLLGPFLPYIGAALVAVIGYFTIKRKGVREERERQEVASKKATEKLTQAVRKAESNDAKVDERVQEKVAEINEKKPEKPAAGFNAGDDFRFKF